MDEEQLSSWPWIISVLDSNVYCCIGMVLCTLDHRRVTFPHETDNVDQSVLNSIRFELVSDKQTIRSIRYQNGMVQ